MIFIHAVITALVTFSKNKKKLQKELRKDSPKSTPLKYQLQTNQQRFPPKKEVKIPPLTRTNNNLPLNTTSSSHEQYSPR